MPKEPRCSICSDATARVAVAELYAQGVSFQNIADRLRLSKASVYRHAKHAHEPRRGTSRANGRKSGQPKRRAGGRCQMCGTLRDDPTPQALVKRAEKVLWFGEEIMQKAIDSEDLRLALQAVDRVRASLEQLMKVHGLLQPDGITVNVAVDARRSLEVWFGGLSEDAIRRLTELLDAGVDLPALVGKIAAPALKDVTDNRALSV